MSLDVYLYGMTCLSTIHVLDGPYPKADSYREIKKTYVVPSGETGNAALILANFGLKVKSDGPHLGTRTWKPVLDFYKKRKIDCSGMWHNPGFDGAEDLVLVDGKTRTIFGKFANYFSGGAERWSNPDLKAIKAAKTVSLDPWFHRESLAAAECCVKEGKKYVTIDLRPDDYIHRNAAATVISPEFTDREMPGAKTKALFKKYADNTRGLVIMTFGEREILYGRKGGKANRFKPFRVKVKGTLAAGDIFRAGIVYGVYKGWDDKKTVAFGAAVGALACERFPAALNPPSLSETLDLIRLRGNPRASGLRSRRPPLTPSARA
jgi:sugar/nucleoside kinase (ribokinase family)